MHQLKNLSINFIIGLVILADLKDDSINSIFVIVNWLTKIRYYELVKVMINTLGLAKVIINMVIYHYGVLESIVIDQGLLFILNF